MEKLNLKSTICENYELIKIKKTNSEDYIKELEELINKLKKKYENLFKEIEENKNKEILIYFGIDSLNFQIKQFDNNITFLKNSYIKIKNRIYGDYFKIHKLFCNYIKNNTNIEIIYINVTQYKDLDYSIDYNFEEITILHNTIFKYIELLYNLIITKKNSLKVFDDCYNKGLYVNNYINEENTNIDIYINKCNLFINYLITFNKYHFHYLNEFNNNSIYLLKNIKKNIDLNNYDYDYDNNNELNEKKENEQDNKDENKINNNYDINENDSDSVSDSDSDSDNDKDNNENEENNKNVYQEKKNEGILFFLSRKN